MIYRMPVARIRSVEEPRTERPAMNIVREDEGIRLQLAVPGFRKEDLQLRVEEGHLVVEGKPETSIPTAGVLRREFAPAPFIRRFRLDERIEADTVEARVEHGILEIGLRFRQPVRHEIAVA